MIPSRSFGPMRIQWDLPPGADHGTAQYREWCDHFCRTNILSLDLWDMLFPSAGCADILESLLGTGIAVSLTVAGLVAPPHILASLEGLAIRRLFLDVGSFEELREVVPELKRFKRAGIAVGISFTATAYNCWDLPDILLYSRINCIETVTVHKPRPDGGGSLCIGRYHRMELARRLGQLDLTGMNLIIDDPFLRRLCPPEACTPGNGCRAAKTTLYISPEAEVFPCPSMPIKLGTLTEQPLAEILGSGLRQEVLARTASLPEACLACPDAQDCNGGCRGRAYALHGSFQGADPACN